MPVVYISSDEEEEEAPKTTDLDWIKDFLLTSDEESDDSDDIVVVSENKPKLKSKSTMKDVVVKKDDSGEDDDCVVLEGDPENGVTSLEEESTGSDELLVVGEKGQIACRDYPHARHLCAKFPFSSTPHERYCAQCHCYVCDSLAPCLNWGTGILSSDHCHANDKTEWKIQRHNLKLGLSSPLAGSTISATSLSATSLSAVVHSQRNANLPRHIVHLPPNSLIQNQASTRSTALHTRTSLNSSFNSISKEQALQPAAAYARSPSPISGVQNQVLRPINIPICRTATNLTVPIGGHHGRCLESGSTLVRERNRPYSVPRQFLGVRSHAIQRERGRNASSLGPQFLRPHVMSKGVVGSPGNTPTANHSARGSSGFNNHVNAVQQPKVLHTPTGFPVIRNINGPGDASHPINVPTFPQSSPGSVSLGCVNQHAVTSETQSYGQALSQSNATQNFHRTFIPGNLDPYMACLNSNQQGIELPIISQNGNAIENSTQCRITSQDTCQPKPREGPINVTAERLPSFDSSWTENASQSVEPVIGCSPLQSSRSINQLPTVEESSTQGTGDIKPHSPSTQVTGNTERLNGRSQLPSSIVDIENWLLSQDSNALPTDGFLPFDFELNIPSPDLSPIDSGTLLTPWWDMS